MYFLLKYTTRQSPFLYYCNNTALIATSEVSGSTTNGFAKLGSSKTGEEYNVDFSCSKYYLYYYIHYYYLLMLSKSIKDATIVAKFSINSL